MSDNNDKIEDMDWKELVELAKNKGYKVSKDEEFKKHQDEWSSQVAKANNEKEELEEKLEQIESEQNMDKNNPDNPDKNNDPNSNDSELKELVTDLKSTLEDQQDFISKLKKREQNREQNLKSEFEEKIEQLNEDEQALIPDELNIEQKLKQIDKIENMKTKTTGETPKGNPAKDTDIDITEKDRNEAFNVGYVNDVNDDEGVREYIKFKNKREENKE